MKNINKIIIISLLNFCIHILVILYNFFPECTLKQSRNPQAVERYTIDGASDHQRVDEQWNSRLDIQVTLFT